MLRRNRDVREFRRTVKERLLAVRDDDLRVGEYLGVLHVLERAHGNTKIVGGKLAGETPGI